MIDSLPDNVIGVPGHIHITESKFLYSLPEQLGGGYYADIGTFKGRSAILVAAGLRNRGYSGRVITVDTFDSYGMAKDKGQDTFEEAIKNIKDRDFLDMIEVYRGLSREASKNYSDFRFKFIFLDADHSYEGVKNDFEVWSPLLQEKGFIGFHDSGTVGVRKFLLELGSAWKKEGQIHSLSWWKRND